jgi:hypothetical protein
VVSDFLRLTGKRDVERIRPLLHPEMKVATAPGIAPPVRRPGREGFLDYFRETEAMNLLMEPDAYEIHACLSGKVLVAGALRFTATRDVSEAPMFYVYTFRDGLISHFETHLKRETAEDAAGTFDFEGRMPSQPHSPQDSR